MSSYTLALVLFDVFLAGIAAGLFVAFYIGHYYVQKEKRAAVLRERAELSQLALDAMNQRIIDTILDDDDDTPATRH